MPAWCAESRVWWGRGGVTHSLLSPAGGPAAPGDPGENSFPTIMLKTGQVPFEYLEDLLFC